MPLLGMLAGGEPLALLCNDVDKTWSGEIPDGDKRIHEHVDIVTIDGAEVAETQLFEKNTRRKKSFHALFPFPDQCRNARFFRRRGFDGGTEC